MQSVTASVVGVFEAAALMGVQAKTVSGYVARGVVMPEPLARLACGPIWSRESIEALVLARDGRDDERATRVELAWCAVVDSAFAAVDVPEYRRSEQARRNVNNGKVARVESGKRRDGKWNGSVSRDRNLRRMRNVKAELLEETDALVRERMAASDKGRRVLAEVERAERLRSRLTRRNEVRLGIA